MPGQNPEPRHAGGFLAGFEEDLESEADAKERFAGGNDVAQGLNQTTAFQFAHGVAEGAHAGQNNAIGVGQDFRAVSDFDLCADMLQCLADAEQVAMP